MERDITPARIANAILQDSRYQGHYILVEGAQDIKIFKSFFMKERANLKVMHGKKNLHDVYVLLQDRGFDRMFGIRDADFLRLPDNEKFNVDYDKPIFPTDFHDAEGMVVNSPALMDFISNISNDEKIKNFEEIHGNLVDLAYSLAYPLACLRLSSKRDQLGLSFKPKDREGNRLKFKKFICEKEIKYLGDEALINTVWEYSKSKGDNVANKEDIRKSFDIVRSSNYDVCEMVNGHDLAEIIFIICKKGLRSHSKLLVDADCIEDLLFLAYESLYFKKSNLFTKIDEWQRNKEITLTL